MEALEAYLSKANEQSSNTSFELQIMPSSGTRFEAKLWPMVKPAANASSIEPSGFIMAIPASGTGLAAVVQALTAMLENGAEYDIFIPWISYAVARSGVKLTLLSTRGEQVEMSSVCESY